MSSPWARQASRIVEPVGTVTSWPSIETVTGAGASTGGATGTLLARAIGVVMTRARWGGGTYGAGLWPSMTSAISRPGAMLPGEYWVIGRSPDSVWSLRLTGPRAPVVA